jgi:hypothetical protein
VSEFDPDVNVHQNHLQGRIREYSANATPGRLPG